MKALFGFILISSLVMSANAQAIEDSKNYFGVTQLTFNGVGISYGHRFGNRWILGASLSGGSTYLGNTQNRTGSLEKGTYYSNSGNVSATLAELTMSYYFLAEGYKESSPLMRVSVGRAQGGLSGYYARYDEDPAVIDIDGDRRRLKEKGPTSWTSWDSLYTRLGGYYQIMWVPRGDRTIGGHILEMGGSVLYLMNPPELQIERPGGENSIVTVQRYMPIAEVTYKFVF